MPTEPHLLDLNVLIALAWPQHVHHERVHAWFATLTTTWMTTPITELGFVRLSTNPSVVTHRVSMNDALAMLAAMRGVPGHAYLQDTSTLAAPVISLAALATSRQVTDAHLVNLAAASGARLATLDRGIEQMLAPNDREHLVVVP
ncbi:MAG TPA: TA system VapC family ribonuclease toxin [Pseudolysinimonas sp.]|nr:TA system VapC family ribonuclease toxin [Pseudolysinimonas sp.]